MKFMIFVIIYFSCAIYSMPPIEAVFISILVAACAAACLKLAGEAGFSWFVQNKARGLAVFAILMGVIGVGVIVSTYSLLAILCQSVMLFFWFWLFGLLGTRLHQHF